MTEAQIKDLVAKITADPASAEKLIREALASYAIRDLIKHDHC